MALRLKCKGRPGIYASTRARRVDSHSVKRKRIPVEQIGRRPAMLDEYNESEPYERTETIEPEPEADESHGEEN